MSGRPERAPMREIATFGANPGRLRMMICAPPSIGADAALVVVLHGCGQSAQQYADGAGWLALAHRFGFVVLCPQGAVAMGADPIAGGGRRADFWRAPSGGVVVERHRIARMAHGAALRTDGADGCDAAGRHLIDVGVSSSGEIARGWGLSRPTPEPIAAEQRRAAP